MKLKDVELVPGVVIDAEDPEHIGRVRAVIPGVFNADIPKSSLPWIHPLTMGGYQQFSKLDRGSAIWFFKIDGNNDELWYIPMFQLYNHASSVVMDGDDADILFSRIDGPNSSNVQYVHGKGFTINVGEDNSLDMNADGTIKMKGGGSLITMENDKTTIGDTASAEPMVLGEKLKKVFTFISEQLLDAAQAAGMTGGDVEVVSGPLLAISTYISNNIDTILSKSGKLT